MANNPYINKVIYGSTTLIDLTSDTVTAADVINSKYLHLPSGERVQGSCTYDADTSDGTATADELLYGEKAYVNGSAVIGTMPNRGAVTLTIDDVDDELSITNGYHDGSGIAKLDATEKAKIIPSNILEGVTILGVAGSVTPSSDIHIEASKTVTPYTTQQTVLPSSGYDAMAQVVVNAISYTETDNASGGKTVTIGDVAPTP